MRLFFSIDVPALPPWNDGAGSAPGADAHLTLRFLGEVPEARLASAILAGREAARGVAPFPLSLAPIGAFPSERSPRVVWVGVEEGRTEVEELARRLERELVGQGFPPEPRPFVPHVTWRRVRSSADARAAQAHLAQGRLAPARAARVDAVDLKESTLSSRGAIHREVERFPLAP